jgi:ATP-binding cassette subfamily F protein 3
MLLVFPGDYDNFLNWKESQTKREGEARKAAKVKEASARDMRRQRKQLEGEMRNKYYRDSAPIKKRIAEIEAELPQLEVQVRECESLFSDPEHYSDSAEVIENVAKHRRLKEIIGSLTEEWAGLSAEAEKIKQEFDAASRNNMRQGPV